MAWAVDADGRLGFGGWWGAYVVRPIFLALLLGWVWRIALVAVWFWRVGRLDLALVPSHPDRTAGLAFVEKLPGAFTMVAFALSALMVSRFAHEIVHHQATFVKILVPVVLPMIAVAALQIPLKDLLLQVLKALV